MNALSNTIRITECPRDAMQGIETWIPTEVKVEYINALLRVGFDVIDFGSFVSSKAIPQLRDTAEVLRGLNLEGSRSKLLAIVANERGASDAAEFSEIDYLGYPFSISETFQKRNTNATIEQSLGRVEAVQKIASRSGKKLLIYISMAFGNPYNDPWSPDLAARWVEKLHHNVGIVDFALADTVGVSAVQNIKPLFETVIGSFPALNIGAHLHSAPRDASQKVLAAFAAGCLNFDVAVNGMGGCPMAEDVLVGNISTQTLISALEETVSLTLNMDAFSESVFLADKVFANP